MWKKFAIILGMALCVSATDVAGQSLMKSLKNKGKQMLKDKVEQTVTNKTGIQTKSSSKKSSTSSSSSSTSSSSSSSRKSRSTQTAAATDATTTTSETKLKYVDTPEDHSLFFEPLNKSEYGTKSPAFTMPSKSSASAQAKWYNAQPKVRTLTNKRLTDEIKAIKEWRKEATQVDETMRTRESELYEELYERLDALTDYVDAVGETDSNRTLDLGDNKEWVMQGCYYRLAYAIESEMYACLMNSAVAPLANHFDQHLRYYFDGSIGVEAADKQTRTLWQPYGSVLQLRTSLPGVYGEWKAEVLVIQGASYFLNKREMTARVESVNREAAEKFANYVVPDTVTDPQGKAYVVTDLRSGAFSGCTFETITLPKTLLHIGDYAFQQMSKVKKIVIPDKVTCLEHDCFQRSTDLVEVYVPNSVVTMGGSNFAGCKKLKTVHLPKNVEKFDVNQFAGCIALETVTLPENLTTITKAMFQDCTALKSIVIPPSAKVIEEYAFSGCSSLASVTFNDGLQEIGESAFAGCKMLTKLNFPETLETIGSDAFSGLTRLTSLVIPNSIKNVETFAFDGCTSLTSITIPEAFKGNNRFLLGFGYSPVFPRDGDGPKAAYIHYR